MTNTGMSENLPRIPVERIRPLRGTMLFHRAEEGSSIGIDIPLEPFDSGLDYVSQPEQTIFADLEIDLSVEAIEELDSQTFRPVCEYREGGSICLGSAHNPVYVREITFHKTGEREYRVTCELDCDFADEGVGQREEITLNVFLDVLFDGKRRDEPKTSRFADLRR